MPAPARSTGRNQSLAEEVRPGSAVQNDERTCPRTYLDARRVTPVTSRARTRPGYRTAGTPKLYAHLADTPQAIGRHGQCDVQDATFQVCRQERRGSSNVCDHPIWLESGLRCQSPGRSKALPAPVRLAPFSRTPTSAAGSKK